VILFNQQLMVSVKGDDSGRPEAGWLFLGVYPHVFIVIAIAGTTTSSQE
jgi:hypothetical protein